MTNLALGSDEWFCQWTEPELLSMVHSSPDIVLVDQVRTAELGWGAYSNGQFLCIESPTQ